jgi:hypothetical protein
MTNSKYEKRVWHLSFLICLKFDACYLLFPTPGSDKPVMSSLLAELGRPAKMTKVRALMVQHITDALAASRFHMHTGHPLLSAVRRRTRGTFVAPR